MYLSTEVTPLGDTFVIVWTFFDKNGDPSLGLRILEARHYLYGEAETYKLPDSSSLLHKDPSPHLLAIKNGTEVFLVYQTVSEFVGIKFGIDGYTLYLKNGPFILIKKFPLIYISETLDLKWSPYGLSLVQTYFAAEESGLYFLRINSSGIYHNLPHRIRGYFFDQDPVSVDVYTGKVYVMKPYNNKIRIIVYDPKLCEEKPPQIVKLFPLVINCSADSIGNLYPIGEEHIYSITTNNNSNVIKVYKVENCDVINWCGIVPHRFPSSYPQYYDMFKILFSNLEQPDCVMVNITGKNPKLLLMVCNPENNHCGEPENLPIVCHNNKQRDRVEKIPVGYILLMIIGGAAFLTSLVALGKSRKKDVRNNCESLFLRIAGFFKKKQNSRNREEFVPLTYSAEENYTKR